MVQKLLDSLWGARSSCLIIGSPELIAQLLFSKSRGYGVSGPGQSEFIAQIFVLNSSISINCLSGQIKVGLVEGCHQVSVCDKVGLGGREAGAESS